MIEHTKFQSALDFYKNHQYGKALKFFDAEFYINESKINHSKNSKSLIFNFKKYRNMIEYLDKILEINSTDPQILARKGHLLEITFQHQNALLCLNKALEIDPL
jgi:tetratricopeptide (TPR) repeat protein